MKKHNHGFTLLEIMIALFIFVVVMGIVVTGFNLIMRSRDQLHERSEQLEQLQMALTIMERDFSQVVDRSVRDKEGRSVLPAMFGPNSTKDFVEFTRAGFVNPLFSLPRSTLLRVAYHLDRGELSRKVWQVLDRAPNSQAESRRLLGGIKLLEITYLYKSTNGSEFVENLNSEIPRAVRLTLDFDNDEHIERVFKVRGG